MCRLRHVTFIMFWNGTIQISLLCLVWLRNNKEVFCCQVEPHDYGAGDNRRNTNDVEQSRQ